MKRRVYKKWFGPKMYHRLANYGRTLSLVKSQLENR